MAGRLGEEAEERRGKQENWLNRLVFFNEQKVSHEVSQEKKMGKASISRKNKNWPKVSISQKRGKIVHCLKKKLGVIQVIKKCWPNVFINFTRL